MSKSDTGPFAIIPLWILGGVSANAVVVYATLASYADNLTGVAWPSHKTMSEDLNLSISTVKRAIKELTDIQALEVRPRRRPDGSKTSSEYTLKRTIPSSQVDGQQVTSEPTTDHIRPMDSPPVNQQELDSINYNHLTKPNELDIAKPKVLRTGGVIEQNLKFRDQDSGREVFVPLGYEHQEYIISFDEPPKRKPNLLWDAMMMACGYSKNDLTKNVQGQIAKAVKQLKDIDVQPPEIIARAKLYRLMWPDLAITPMALVNRWADLTPEHVQRLATPQQRNKLLRTIEKQQQDTDDLEQHRKELFDRGVIDENGNPRKALG